MLYEFVVEYFFRESEDCLNKAINQIDYFYTAIDYIYNGFFETHRIFSKYKEFPVINFSNLTEPASTFVARYTLETHSGISLQARSAWCGLADSLEKDREMVLMNADA